MNMYIDTHTHFDLIFENKDINEQEIFDNMNKNNISGAVQISIEPEGFQWSLDFAKKHKDFGILFSLGIHPSSSACNEKLDILEKYITKVMNSDDSNLLFGIGECGLDFYRMRQKKEMQVNSFEFQINQAKKYKLPLIVHSRDAMEDVIKILKDNHPESGIMHCFPGDRIAAKKILDLGFHISFAGNVTYKNAHALHESAAYVPLDKILVETDAPFLTPVPLRGKTNRPEYIINTYKFISNLRKIELEKLTEAVNNNYKKLKSQKVKNPQNY